MTQAASPDAAAAKTREQLNPGYSLLYQEAEGLPKIHWILMFKDKSGEVDKLVGDTLDFYRSLTATLDELAKQHPDVKLQLLPMPDIEARAREAQGKDAFSSMKPIVGKSGTAFERELLLLLRSAIDEQRHLIGVMIPDEPDADLKAALQKTQTQLDRLYQRYDHLLNKRYFTH